MEPLHCSIITLVFSTLRLERWFPAYHSAKTKESFQERRTWGGVLNKKLKKILILSKDVKEKTPPQFALK